jgi:hypothetical protein
VRRCSAGHREHIVPLIETIKRISNDLMEPKFQLIHCCFIQPAEVKRDPAEGHRRCSVDHQLQINPIVRELQKV